MSFNSKSPWGSRSQDNSDEEVDVDGSLGAASSRWEEERSARAPPGDSGAGLPSTHAQRAMSSLSSSLSGNNFETSPARHPHVGRNQRQRGTPASSRSLGGT